MGIKGFFLGFMGVVLLGCSSTQKSVVANAELDNLIESQALTFTVRTVEPQVTTALAQVTNTGLLPPGNTVGSINVAGAGYFLTLNGDQVSANMPYYGERQMGGGFGSDTGITFDSQAKDLNIVKNETKQRYAITFTVDDSSESYFVTLDIASNMKGEVRVRSSHRNRIRYQGAVAEISTDKLASR